MTKTGLSLAEPGPAWMKALNSSSLAGEDSKRGATAAADVSFHSAAGCESAQVQP